jgi:hypothetical protein
MELINNDDGLDIFFAEALELSFHDQEWIFLPVFEHFFGKCIQLEKAEEAVMALGSGFYIVSGAGLKECINKIIVRGEQYFAQIEKVDLIVLLRLQLIEEPVHEGGFAG